MVLVAGTKDERYAARALLATSPQPRIAI